MSDIIIYRPLAVLEAEIADGKGAFLKVARALAEIRDGKLYRQAGYGTFEAYCQHRWGFSREMGYQYLAAGKAAENVAAVLPPGKAPGFNQSMALARLKPDQQREVVRELDLDKATVRDVKAAVRKKLGKPEPLPSKLYSRAVHSPPVAPTEQNVNQRFTSAVPLHLPRGFLRLELSRDGRGFLSFLVVKDDNGHTHTTRQYHDTDADALAHLAACLAHPDQGGCPDLNADLAESVSRAPYFPKSDLLDNNNEVMEEAVSQ